MPPGPPTFTFSRWLFLRLLGIVYLIAFVSLGVQIAGLVGEGGILPLEELLPEARDVYGARAYRLLPTLAWISPSATFLEWLCWGGAAASLFLAANVAPVPALFLLWLLYLSVTVAGQIFLQFQWDALLLETGLVAILYAPTHLGRRFRDDTEPLGIVRWVLWLLAFKLTFLSGITKLVSGDAMWANWTALTYHYETQPIPAWTSWFAHQMPRWVHVGSTPVLLCIELLGSPDASALVGPNPLGAPPRYARLALYQYHFTTAEARAETGAWWKREFVEYLTEPFAVPPP